MDKDRKNKLMAELALLSCGLIWGGAFVVMKNSLDMLSINWLLAFRFMLAAIVLGAILFCKHARPDRQTLRAGIFCGILMYLAYYVQTYGLQHTTAGNNAFVTSIYVVLVPFIHWAISKQKPRARVITAGLICIAGVAAIALNADFSLDSGSLYTLLSSVFFAWHIVCVSIYSQRGIHVMRMTAIQFASSAVCAVFMGALLEPFPAKDALFSIPVLSSLLYLGLVCTLLALTLQNIGLRYAPPAHASLFMSTEAPFGFLAGVLLLNEPFSLRFLFGASLIAGAIVLSQMGQQQSTKSMDNAIAPIPQK